MMNKAFEKIIERVQEIADHNGIAYIDTADIIEIVQEVAEEYNGGWIPCIEQLPEQPKENPIFENNTLELYLVTVKNTEYAFRAFWNGKHFTDGFGTLDVIAWQPLPEPFKERD